MGTSGLVSLLKDHNDRVLKSPFRYNFSQCDDKAVIRQAQHEQVLLARDIQREKAVYKRLGQHPYLLQYYKTMGDGICLEYMPMGTLRNYLTSTAASSIIASQRRDWIMQATRGLQHLHSNNIIWSDPSTQNCLLANDLSLRICDFAGSGLQRLAPTVGPCGRSCKSWDESPSIASDLFGLGSMIYEIVTETLPFQDLSEEKAQHRFSMGQFLDTEGLTHGEVI
jgi:serine/threonine protein kinase